MPSQATVTGKTGPAQTITSQLFQNVVRLEILPYPKSVCSIQTSDGKIQEFDIQATTTFTLGPSSGNLTVVISQ